MPVPLRNAPRSVACVALVLVLAGLVLAPTASARSSRAVLAFLPRAGGDDAGAMLERLQARPRLALGLLSATQGHYTPQQALLDITAGSRTSIAVYRPKTTPRLELGLRGSGRGFVRGWSAATARAKTALAEIDPGMLASRIPGGAAYAGVRTRRNLEAVAAADREGEIAAVSLGPAADLGARAHRLLIHHRLVVVGLPNAARGDAALDRLLRDHRPGDVLVVVQTPRHATTPQLLAAGAVLPRSGPGLLTSSSTRLDGVVAGIDIPATILGGLGLGVPDGVKGQAMRAEGTRDAGALERTEARLRVVNGRRTPAIFALLFTWAALTLALGLVADRRGIRAGLRIGGLAMLWVPAMLLVTGWLAPTRLAEIAIVTGGSFALAALTDRLVRWPRGPLVPAAVALIAHGADLASGSPFIIRSLLGVNPRSGSRFYGLGNELEAALVVLLLVALGALLMRRADLEPSGAGPGRSRRPAAIVVVAGLVAAVFVGAGQLGADVGGVITLGAGISVMAVLMLPGPPSRRLLALAVLAPVLAVAGLAALDLATGGNGHFTRTILEADGAGALWDVVARRYTLAFNILRTGAMPFVAALAVLAVAYAVRYRERIYAPLRGSPAWRAALAGGLAAAIAGTAFNDSGPILLVIGVFVLASVTAYVRGDPDLARADRMP
jgi:hypothetical protein